MREKRKCKNMKEVLKGSAKTKNKTNLGKPDFHIEKCNILVVFEDKLGTKKLISKTTYCIKDAVEDLQLDISLVIAMAT